MDFETYILNQSKRNPLIMNYKIFIFLLMFNLFFENSVRKLLNNEIKLVIQGKGEQQIINENFRYEPDIVLVNGIQRQCKKSCNLEEDKNNITLIFYSPPSTFQNMFNGLENIIEIDLSNFDLNNYSNMNQMFYHCSSLKFLNLYLFSQGTEQISRTFEGIPSNVVYCINDANVKNNLVTFLKEKRIYQTSLINYDYNYCFESCNDNIYQYNNICYNKCPIGSLLDNYFCLDNKCSENNFNSEECLNGKPRGYYYDSSDQIYKKCFYSCDSCYGEGSSTSHNCKTCKENYKLIYENNCYEICKYYYYFDNNNNYHCTLDKICPKEYSKLIIPNNKCVEECDNNYFNNQNNNINNNDVTNFCYEFQISGINDNTEIYNKIKDNILESYDAEKGNILVMEGFDNTVFEITTNVNELNLLNSPDLAYNFNLSIIDLAQCESLLKEKNGIDENIPLIFLKQEKLTNKASEKNVQFEVYEPLNKIQLNLSICSEIDINLYVKLELSQEMKDISEQVKKLGYNMFDKNDKFYKDICTPYKSIDKTDVLLSDRLNYIFNNNDVQCQSNCDFSNYYFGSEYINCKCNFSEEINDNMNIKEEKLQKKNIYEVFYDTLKNPNYKVLKCYHLVFNTNILIKNIGSTIVIVFSFFHLICLFIFMCKGISPLADTLINKIEHNNTNEDISNQIVESEMLEINKKSRNSIIKKKLNLKNPPPKIKKNPPLTYIYKKRNIIDNIEQIIKKIKKPIYSRFLELRKSKLFSQKINPKIKLYPKNANNKINNNTKLRYNKSISIKIDNLYKDKKMQNLDEYQMSDLDYINALRYDKRTFIQTYITFIKREHSLIFTFFVCNDLNISYIKISRFLFLLASVMTMNVFFFSDESLHKLYISYGKYDFVQQIPQILYSTIISQIIEIFLCYLSLTDKYMYELKEMEEISKNRKSAIKILKCIKIKLIGFYIVTIIFFGFFWYTVSAFCAVYENTQIPFIKDSTFSLVLSTLLPFFIYLIPSAFRVCSLRNKQGNSECLYKLSDVIPFF